MFLQPSVSASALPSTSEPTNESTSIDQDRQGDVDSENIDRQTEDIEEMSPDTAEMLMELEREKENSPLLTPSSSSDDAPYMSDEEVQCEDIPESFELESTEALTAINAPIDLSRLQPPSSRRMCSPVDPLELEDDVLESIPEEDESCSPIKSPRSKQEDGTHFPMPAPEHYQSHNHQQLLLPQKSQPIRSNRVVTSAADTDPISTTVATTTLETVIATPAAASLSQRILASSNILLRSTPMLHVMSIDATVTTASVPAEKACKSYRRGHSGSNRSSGLAQPAELRHHLQLLATSTSSAVPGGDCDDRITAARPQEKSPTNKSSTLAASRNLKKVLADTEKAVVTLHSNVPEQKSSANSSSTTTSSCVDVCGMTVGSTGGSGPINSSSSSNSSGSSPLKPFCGLPSRFQQGDSNRRASDVGPQSKCPKERAQFSPQYSLPEQKKFQKELTASCEQLFRRRLSPQRQQEIRSDPLNELLRGSTKSVAGKPTLPEPALVGLQQQPLPQQWDDPRSRGGSISVSPEPLGLSVSRRRTPELRTSPLEMLAQELWSSSDDLYRRAAASTDHSQLAIDISQLVVDPSNPALLER